MKSAYECTKREYDTGRGSLIMENKLEKMRKEITRRMQLACSAVCGISILMGLIGTKTIPSIIDENQAEFMMGFQAGLLIVLDIALMLQFGKCYRALKDDKKLKQLYYKEHDECECYIAQMAGKKSMNITEILLVVLAVIAGNYSFDAFLALIAAVLVVAAVNFGIMMYYTHVTTGVEE